MASFFESWIGCWWSCLHDEGRVYGMKERRGKSRPVARKRYLFCHGGPNIKQTNYGTNTLQPLTGFMPRVPGQFSMSAAQPHDIENKAVLIASKDNTNETTTT